MPFTYTLSSSVLPHRWFECTTITQVQNIFSGKETNLSLWIHWYSHHSVSCRTNQYLCLPRNLQCSLCFVLLVDLSPLPLCLSSICFLRFCSEHLFQELTARWRYCSISLLFYAYCASLVSAISSRTDILSWCRILCSDLTRHDSWHEQILSAA